MPLYRPTELKQFLAELQTAPKKRLSQNFLIDGNVLQKILIEADIQEGDTVLEIGAGPGALTEALLERKCQVIAVEKDSVFATALHRFPGLQVYEGDILEFSLDHLPKDKKIKVVANLPYHLTSPILDLLLPRNDLFSKVTVMVQEEVAQRITAKPHTKDYSSLTLFCELYSDPRYAFFVKRKSFYPAPKVDSAVLTFTLKKPLTNNCEGFLAFIHMLFCHRRKMIKSIMPEKKTQIETSLIKLGLSPLSRPENLSLNQFLTLYLDI